MVKRAGGYFRCNRVPVDLAPVKLCSYPIFFHRLWSLWLNQLIMLRPVFGRMDYLRNSGLKKNNCHVEAARGGGKVLLCYTL